MELHYDKLDRIVFNKIFFGLRDPLKIYFIQQFECYKQLFNFTSTDNAYEIIGSMYLAFLFSFTMSQESLTLSNTASKLKDNLYFALIYGLVDHLLDSQCIDDNYKQQELEAMKQILYQDICPTGMSDVLSALYHIYQHFRDRKEVIDMLKFSFQCELNSYLYQYQPQTAAMYKKLCLDKGYSIFLLHKAINEKVFKPYDQHIGYILQLCDDVLDVEDDKQDNINTLCTNLLDQNNNLDSLYQELITELNSIPNEAEAALYKIILTDMIYYVSYNSKYISEKVKSNIKRSKLFETKDKLIKRLGSVLYHAIY